MSCCLHEFRIIDLEDTIVYVYLSVNGKGNGISGNCLKAFLTVCVVQALDLRTDTTADLHPEIHLITGGKSSGQLHRDHVGGTIIGCDTSDQKTAVIRATVTHHVSALPFFHICSCKITIEYLRQMGTVRIINCWSLSIKIIVNRFTVRMHNRRNVFRPLHASFNFKGVNARIKQLRDEFDRIQIAR